MGEKLKTEEKKERTKANGILYHVRVVFSDSIASTFIQRGCFRAEYWFRKRTLIQRKSSIRIGHSNKENIFVVHIQF